MADLPYTLLEVTLQTTTGGKLLPWLGPALRGLVAGRLKARACQRTDDQGSRPEYCRGCAFQKTCAYGQLFEPEDPRDGSEIARPVVIAPYYPAPPYVAAGAALPLRLVAIGRAGRRHFSDLVAALSEVGVAPGIGPDRVRFRIDETWRFEGRLRRRSLVASGNCEGDRIPRLGIGLRSPLILRQRHRSGRRRTVAVPTLGDLFAAASSTLDRLFAADGAPLAADFDVLQEVANNVSRVDHCFESFRQPKWSSRSQQRYEVFGCVGGGVFADVPAVLLPWLYWGGLLHVAGHRVAGAGGWRVILD